MAIFGRVLLCKVSMVAIMYFWKIQLNSLRLFPSSIHPLLRLSPFFPDFALKLLEAFIEVVTKWMITSKNLHLWCCPTTPNQGYLEITLLYPSILPQTSNLKIQLWPNARNSSGNPNVYICQLLFYSEIFTARWISHISIDQIQLFFSQCTMQAHTLFGSEGALFPSAHSCAAAKRDTKHRDV